MNIVCWSDTNGDNYALSNGIYLFFVKLSIVLNWHIEM